jgi:hypothetical protein
VYLGLLGALLLSQGVASAAARASDAVLPPLVQAFVNADPLHAAIHVAWGAGLLLLAAFVRDGAWLARAGLIFGVFYSALALLGTVFDQPFGLSLGLGENTFHSIVGPTTLVWAVLAVASGQRRVVAPAFPGHAAAGEDLSEAADGEQEEG